MMNPVHNPFWTSVHNPPWESVHNPPWENARSLVLENARSRVLESVHYLEQICRATPLGPVYGQIMAFGLADLDLLLADLNLHVSRPGCTR